VSLLDTPSTFPMGGFSIGRPTGGRGGLLHEGLSQREGDPSKSLNCSSRGPGRIRTRIRGFPTGNPDQGKSLNCSCFGNAYGEQAW
jgi:hypothetical protein